jgi:hypothetical protein
MTDDAAREAQPEPQRGPEPALAIGAILVVVGALLLAAQLIDVDWGDFGWPFYVIAPGVVLVAIGLSQRSLSGLTIGGSVVSMVGLLLLYQNLTDHWESWAYAWALVAPGGSGIGMLLHGARAGDGQMARAGFWQVVTGTAIFIAGFIFFEQIIGISGQRLDLPEWVLPGALIGLGVLVLARGLIGRRQEG